MENKDILFQRDEYIFSYRVAGLLIRNGKILLQKPVNTEDYAVPGGHCAFGETNAETLRRELMEEIGADVAIGDLKFVGEIFFPWRERRCHQICLFYEMTLTDEATIPLEGAFFGTETLEDKTFRMEFAWIRLEELKTIELYPKNLIELLPRREASVVHFIYWEK